MSAGRLWISIALSVALGGAVIPLASADEKTDKTVPAQQPAVPQVSCEFIEIWATNGKPPAVDPALSKALVKRLTSVFGAKYNDYKQLSSSTVTLTKKKPETLKLKKGAANVTLVEIVDNTKIRITVDFTSVKGKASQTQLVDAGDWVTTAVQQPNGDGHLLAGSCK